MEELNQDEIIQEETLSTENELLEMFLNTREQYQMMEHFIKNQIVIKDEMIDKLYKELEYYKQEAAERFVEQFLKSFIKVHKDMKKIINSEKFNEISLEDIKKEYQYIFEDITDLFEQQNIDSYHSNSGDNFNAVIHQPKIEYTTDITLDKKVKESLSEGYSKGSRILIPERVIVYQYREEQQ